MKSLLLKLNVLAVAGLVLGAPLVLQAQTAAPAATPAGKGKSAAPKKIEYMGKLTAIDASGNSITVQVKQGPLTLQITSATGILKDKKPAKLSDFAAGDKVTGSYIKEEGGALTAASLHKKTMGVLAQPTADAPAAK